MPSSWLSGSAIAGGIAFINAIGNLGGFAGPYLVGLFKGVSNSYADGLYALAAFCVAACTMTAVFIRPHRKAASFDKVAIGELDEY